MGNTVKCQNGRNQGMNNWKENLAQTRINILRLSNAHGECLTEIGRNSGVEPDKLATFVAGADSLTFGELQRVCEWLEFPYWAVHVPEVCMDLGPWDPNTLAVEQHIVGH